MPEATVQSNRAVSQLEAILQQQIALHDHMFELLQQKRDAITRADAAGIEQLSRAENNVIQQLGELEKQRLHLTAELTQTIDPTRTEPMRLRELAACMDEPEGGRLAALAAMARERIERVRETAAILRTATEALAAHIGGVMQAVHSTLANARIYERRGRITCGAQVTSTLDLTS